MRKLLLGAMALLLVILVMGCSHHISTPAGHAALKEEQTASATPSKDGIHKSKEGTFSF
ncbi:hypothetical protein [Brevibacillus laterosporus]|uniref:hypothetical protein n=1 Tax=Brevibacillus laterosporus TaxID=1465 RepID=UPI00264CB560|nr:hypothetical protein [Brevibacillus laterosporus]MDN9009344.1 hypothetical protein [Brevibacillus laterosporus]MDO0940113.1 hypothetical protein [Brevibacillus laterosporus]